MIPIAKNAKLYADLLTRKRDRLAAGLKKRVALLLRVSDKKQTKDDQEVPIPVQRDYLLKLVQAHSDEWELATRDVSGQPQIVEYTEAGVSAFKLSKDDRELLTAAMIDAAADRFDVLLIYKQDRLSRNSEEYPVILRQFANMGVDVWVCDGNQQLKANTQADKLLRYIEGWQAETESVNTRMRVTNAMKRMAENGAWTGGKTSYGYRLKEFADAPERPEGRGRGKKRPVRGIEIAEDEARWVRLMFDLYVNQGLGGTQIATLINNPPYAARKRNGQPWDGPQILEVIKNPIYMGRPAWGKNSYQSGQRVRKPTEEWVWAEELVPQLQLVDEATWRKAQELRKERFGLTSKGKGKMPPRSFTSHLLLTGTAYCGHCGQPLVTKTYSNKRTLADGTVVHDKYEGYICRNHKRGAKSECAGKRGYWRRNLIEDAVLDMVHQWFGQFDFDQVRGEVVKSYEAGQSQAEISLEAVKERVDGLLARRNYYTDQLNLALTGKKTRIPLTVIEDQLSEIEEQLTKSQEQLDQLSRDKGAQMVEDETLRLLSEILPNWATAFRQSPPHQRKFLLNQVVEKVVVFDDTMEVTVNVKIKEILEAAQVAENQTASALDGSLLSRPLAVHQGKHRGTTDVRVYGQNAGPSDPVRG